MGKSMYDYGTRTKERERQQKQIDKASKRIMAKQKENADLKTHTPNENLEISEPGLAEEIVKRPVFLTDKPYK